jgi:hypothetical protein
MTKEGNGKTEEVKWINLKGKVRELTPTPPHDTEKVEELVIQTRGHLAGIFPDTRCEDCDEYVRVFPIFSGKNQSFYICEMDSGRLWVDSSSFPLDVSESIMDQDIKVEIVYRTHSCSGHRLHNHKRDALTKAARKHSKKGWGKVM